MHFILLESLDSITEFLKNYYRVNEYDEINHYAWPPMEAHHYSNVQMFAHNKNVMSVSPYHQKAAFSNKQTPENIFTEMSHLFDFDYEIAKKPNKILFLGAPGIGKSFVCLHIAYLWANNQLGKWKFVFLVQLKSIYIKDLIFSIFSHVIEEESILKACKNSYTKWKHGEALLILDGWDEISSEKQNQFDKILCHRILHRFDIVVTSRHSSSANLKKYNFNKTIEIIGFNKESMHNFIRNMIIKNECKANPDTILNYLTKHAAIKRFSRIPIILRIVVFILIHEPPNSSVYALQSIAELYEMCICTLIKHFFLKYEAKSNTESTVLADTIIENDMLSLQDIIENIDHIPIKQYIEQLTKLAYSGLTKNQATFTRKELSNEYLVKEETFEFGIKINVLQSVQKILKVEENLFFVLLT